VASGVTSAPPPPSATSLSQPASAASASAPSQLEQRAHPSVNTEGWTTHESKALKVSFRFPKEMFTLTEPGSKIQLTSKLSRGALGENTTAKHVFSLVIEKKTGAPEAVLAKDYPSYAERAFPKGISGGLAPDNESVTRAKLAGLEGYRLSGGVEGYNSEVLFLRRDKNTLIAHADIVGGIMGPETPEETQRAIIEAIFASIVVK
jgi:hypothetical protein